MHTYNSDCALSLTSTILLTPRVRAVRKAEEEMHIKEGVPWKDIEFADNQPAIELLEKPPQGASH